MAKIQVAEPKERFIAAAIDLVPPFLLFLIMMSISPGPAAIIAILGSVYLIFKDVLGNGQSLGKRIVNLQVVDAETDRVPDPMALILRNLGFGIPGLNVIYAIVEGIQTIRHPQGLRFGDMFAETGVVMVPAEEREKLLVPKRVSGTHRVVTGEGKAVKPPASDPSAATVPEAPAAPAMPEPPRKAPAPIDLPPETPASSSPAPKAAATKETTGVEIDENDPLKALVEAGKATGSKS